MFCNYSMLVALHRIGKVQYRLLGTDGCHVKAKNEGFTAAGWRRRNIKYQYFMSSFGRLRQKKEKEQKAYCTFSTIYFLHSTNQIIDFRRCRCRYFLNSLFQLCYGRTNLVPRVSLLAFPLKEKARGKTLATRLRQNQ